MGFVFFMGFWLKFGYLKFLETRKWYIYIFVKYFVLE